MGLQRWELLLSGEGLGFLWELFWSGERAGDMG